MKLPKIAKDAVKWALLGNGIWGVSQSLWQYVSRTSELSIVFKYLSTIFIITYTKMGMRSLVIYNKKIKTVQMQANNFILTRIKP